MNSAEYALGESAAAQRRLDIQDVQSEEVSESLLDELSLRPNDRVVELGIGPGGFGRRILRRLGRTGVLVGVDYTQNFLDRAQHNLAEYDDGRFRPVLANIQELGTWIREADVVVGRTVLHHLPMAEAWLGKLISAVRPATRIGFIEPEFRVLLARLAIRNARCSDELETLRIWAEGIIRYYTLAELSLSIGATMTLALQTSGCRDVKYSWREFPMDQTTIQNILLYYEEVREKYCSMKIMTNQQIDEQKRRIGLLPAEGLPAVTGMHCVSCVVD